MQVKPKLCQLIFWGENGFHNFLAATIQFSNSPGVIIAHRLLPKKPAMNIISLLLIAPTIWGKAEPVQRTVQTQSTQHSKPQPHSASPLSDFSAQWDDPKYQACNTALTVNYMSKQEKDVI
jgi:hypothetical protein